MIFSPLRYPGGKAKLYPFFVNLIKSNQLFGSEYYEPYAGGAGLALRLLEAGFVEKIHINDIDPGIYSFWCSILNRSDEFCKLLTTTPLTIEEWYRQRDIWTKCDTSDELNLGFATYFLNRTNRSGIIEGAGPIGGYAQSGKWKLDARLIKSKQVKNIENLARYRSQINICNIDALDFVDRALHLDNALIYLDPPYFVKGKKLYKNFYNPEDHKQIADKLSDFPHSKWVVSYDDVTDIRSIYAKFTPISYFLNYSAGEKGLGREVIYLSDALAPPIVQGFRIAA